MRPSFVPLHIRSSACPRCAHTQCLLATRSATFEALIFLQTKLVFACERVEIRKGIPLGLCISGVLNTYRCTRTRVKFWLSFVNGFFVCCSEAGQGEGERGEDSAVALRRHIVEVVAPGTQTTGGTGGRGVAEEGPGNPGTGVVGGGAQEPGGVVVQGPSNQGRSVGGGEAVCGVGQPMAVAAEVLLCMYM